MKRTISTLVLLTILLLLTVSALAQDDATAVPTDSDVPAETQEVVPTEEPTSELASATPLPTGTPLPTATDLPTLTPVPDFTPTPLPADDGTGGNGGSVSGGSVLLVVIGVLMVFSAGGNVVTMIANFRKDRAATAATEQLGNSIPSQVGDRLLNTIDTLTGLLGIARESLDRVPAASKPPETPVLVQFTTAELNAELARRASAG